MCYGQIVITFSNYTLIHHTAFTDVSIPLTNSHADSTRLPAVIALYKSTLHLHTCDFTANNISAVRAMASNVTVSGDLMFPSNRAFAGTAFVFTYGSILTSAGNRHILFLDNYVTGTGAMFYITNNNKYLSWHQNGYDTRTHCFLNTEGNRFQKRFTLVNNSAEKGGDVLYGGTWYGWKGKLLRQLLENIQYITKWLVSNIV